MLLYKKKKLPQNYKLRYYPDKWLAKQKQFHQSIKYQIRPNNRKWYLCTFFTNYDLEAKPRLPLGSSKTLALYQRFWSVVWRSNLSRLVKRFLTNFHLKPLRLIHAYSFLNSPESRVFQHKVVNLCFFYRYLLTRGLHFLGGYVYFKKKEVIFVYDYKLYFTFSPRRFYINLRSYSLVNYFSLSVGLLLKFFKYKKSLKKTKTFKFLLVKFLRKLLITTNMQRFVLFFKRSPVLLNEVIRFLTQPLIAPFYDPIREQTVLEDESKPYLLQVHYVYFLRAISYTSMKRKQKGRLKRKITKKIIRKNRITDEA